METRWVTPELVFQKCGCLANPFGAHSEFCRTYRIVENGVGLVRWELRPICQVHNFRTSEITCSWTESGGKRCEVPGEHTRHEVGRHTMYHALAGNGYVCDGIEERWVNEDAR